VELDLQLSDLVLHLPETNPGKKGQKGDKCCYFLSSCCYYWPPVAVGILLILFLAGLIPVR
jgi:hypothetical protein